MSTYVPPVQAHHRPHINPWLVAVIVLAAALIGLGAFEAVDRTTGGGATQNATTLATQQATTLIDNYYADLSAGNVNAATARFTSDAIIRNSPTSAWKGTAQIHKYLAIVVKGHMAPTRIAPVTVLNNFATTYNQANVWGIWTSVVTFEFRDGKIFREWSSLRLP